MINVIEIDDEGVCDWHRYYCETVDEAVEEWLNGVREVFPRRLVKVAFFNNSDFALFGNSDVAFFDNSEFAVMSAGELESRWGRKSC